MLRTAAAELATHGLNLFTQDLSSTSVLTCTCRRMSFWANHIQHSTYKLVSGSTCVLVRKHTIKSCLGLGKPLDGQQCMPSLDILEDRK